MDHAAVAAQGETLDASAANASAAAALAAAWNAPDARPAQAIPVKSPRRFKTLLPACGLAFLLGAGIATLWGHRTANAPVALVNGEAISAPAFNHRLEVAAGANVLQQMIEEKLQAQLAAKQGVTPSDSFVEEKYKLQSAQPGFEDSLKKSRQTPEDVKAGIHAALTSQALVSRGVTVTDEDIRHFYEANTDPRNLQARYYRPETARVAVIISDKPDDIKNALHDLASGVAFAQVAARYSKDQSKANGGLLPPIRRGGTDAQKFPGLEAALMGMKPGQQIDTFKTAGAMWIIRCVERGAEQKVPYDKVKEECRQGALLTKGAQTNGQSLQAQLQQFHKDAKIDILRPEYKDIVGAK